MYLNRQNPKMTYFISWNDLENAVGRAKIFTKLCSRAVSSFSVSSSKPTWGYFWYMAKVHSDVVIHTIDIMGEMISPEKNTKT